MPESIKQRTNAMATHRDAEAVRFLITALRADVAALRTALIATNAKLDNDAGVTDTNYGALNNPPALTTNL
ncbi:hypothetical protein H8L32_16860 [Undibacterium sp. CY18W]|uniref:Uncharacterized protein n=1 Tax=Undibacterium hunanense TaxID=2762292 RepID=A0ABR6ZTI9_9BURK|nr:hypothetical protein [Undibacterium hunanense]MBC3919165.1 hypothetical protein [Undibacterium hunanense]